MLRDLARRRFMVFAAVLLLTPWPAFALTVFPVRLELIGNAKVLTIVATNDKDEPVTVQVIPKHWSQKPRPNETPEDVLEDTRDFTVFPGVLQLNPQQKQTVRLRFNGKADALKERSYRLFVEELAVNLNPGVINVLQRFSVPIFVHPIKQEPSPLKWRVEAAATGTAVLVVDNSSGNRHYQVTGLSFESPGNDASKTPEKVIQLFQYLLPGSAATLPLKTPPPANATGAALTTDYGTFRIELPGK